MVCVVCVVCVFLVYVICTYWDVIRNGFTLRLLNLNFRGLSPAKGAKAVGSRRGSLVCATEEAAFYVERDGSPGRRVHL